MSGEKYFVYDTEEGTFDDGYLTWEAACARVKTIAREWARDGISFSPGVLKIGLWVAEVNPKPIEVEIVEY